MSSGRVVSESLGYTIIYYTGVLIGMASTLFVYPRDFALYGLYGFLTNAASLFTPFITLGFGSVLIRYFPAHSQADRGGGPLFTLVALGYLSGMIFFAGLFWGLGHRLVSWMPGMDPEARVYILWLLPLTLLYVIYDLIQTCSVNHRRIVMPASLVNAFKILLPVIFLLTLSGLLNRTGFIICVLCYYALITLFLIAYIRRINPDFFRLDFSLLRSEASRGMWKFAAFNIISGVSAVLALRIDALMVTAWLGTVSAGMYVMALFMSNAVYIPAQSLTEILNPFVAEASKSEDRQGLLNYYRKSVVTMLLPTLWLSMILWFAFEGLSGWMPNSQAVMDSRGTLGFLLLARIVDASTGVNHHIINYSKYYKLESILLLLLAFSNVLLNLLLIPVMGMAGAALGTLISVGAYNLIKSAAIWSLMGLNPFGREWVQIIATGFTIFLLLTLLPAWGASWMNMLLRSGLISVVFFWLILYRGVSPDIRSFIFKKWNQICRMVSG